VKATEQIIKLASNGIKGLDYASPVVDLGVRIWVAHIFWNSGLTKIQSWYSTVQLFTYEYHVPLLPPELAAYLAAIVEIGGSVLLATGFAARFGTVALFILNYVAVISYPDLSDAGRTNHLYWGLLLLFFLFHGPGKLSVDYFFIRRRYMNF